MINNEDIGLIKSYVNMPMLIEHFNIFINQKNYAICPFHNDKSPSMQIFNGYLESDGYYCRACGAGGDIFNFAMEYLNITFEESVNYLARYFNIPLTNSENILKADIEKMNKRINDRKYAYEVQKLEYMLLSALSTKIHYFEYLKENVRPFSEIFCYVCNVLPVLQHEWDILFNNICNNKKGRAIQ
ncbi:CHC2 zinc finger domain-containing protein [Robinsoniella peoriensis]|uniref:CHC2 zinc finger domain-containing protein n=1 Tax=Robinsoniella peoriensis TaxID=180332 RepID=UPI00085BBC41|nr:CHC2 zinc finger domain-containing protein [Robinsoniella peoriensis]